MERPADAFQRALAALKENRLEEALSDMTAAEREHPDDARIRNFRGIALVQTGKSAEAASEFKESIRLAPAMEDAYRNLGFLQWSEHQLADARETLEHAVKLSPDDSFAHYYLGRVELDAHRYESAFRELDLSRQPLPDNAEFLLELTSGYVAMSRPDDARKSLARLTQETLTDQQTLQAADLLLAVHKNDEAIELLGNLRARLSPAPATWKQFDLSLAHFLAGNYAETVKQSKVYVAAADHDSPTTKEQAQAWSLIGIAYAHLKQSEAAIEALRKAASLTPDDETQWLNLTLELMELRRYPEAINAAQSGLAASPKSYALHLRLGAAYLAAGLYPEAEKVFRDLVTAGDPLPTGYIGLAQVLLRTSRAEEAVLELEVGEKKLGPTFLLSYFRGLALERVAKHAEALAAFQEAIRSNPNNAEAHLYCGKTHYAMHQVDKAIAEYNETLRLDPDNVQAKRLLSQAYRRAGDTTNATKFAEASSEPALPEGDLLGDFFVPQWQVPPEVAK